MDTPVNFTAEPLTEAQRESAVVDGPQMAFGVKGISCDTPSCDYADMDVPYSDYPQWLNKPCPQCSAPLLTQAHMDELDAMIKTAEAMNRLTDEQMQAIAQQLQGLSDEEVVAMLDTLPPNVRAGLMGFIKQKG